MTDSVKVIKFQEFFDPLTRDLRYYRGGEWRLVPLEINRYTMKMTCIISSDVNVRGPIFHRILDIFDEKGCEFVWWLEDYRPCVEFRADSSVLVPSEKQLVK